MLRAAAVLVALVVVSFVFGCAKRDARRPTEPDAVAKADPPVPPRPVVTPRLEPKVNDPVVPTTVTPAAPAPAVPAVPPAPPKVEKPAPVPPAAGGQFGQFGGQFGGGQFGGGQFGYGGGAFGGQFGQFGGGQFGQSGQPAAGAPANPSPPTGYNAQNDEKYDSYAENEFRSPLVAPLSTFSADVNTASYSNVRRILTSGKLPPKDAVFLAEFANYFPYSYAPPKGNDPVAFDLEMGPCPWNRQHHLVRIGVQAGYVPVDKLPARNLVFLIDTSGSMGSENRLPLVKKSLGLLVNALTEKDRVSIVTYAGDTRVALLPTRGSEQKVIMSKVNELSAGGGTNGEGGIKKAYELARQTFIDGGVNRVILCTDGDFNVGQTSKGELVKMIEEQRRSNVFLTILGYGMGNYKDDTLKALANHGNGHHAYIDTVDEAKKVFVDQGGALVCVAKDVKFQVDFNPAKVNAYRLIGYENRKLKAEDFKNDAKDAGDMGSGHQVTALYEIVPAGVKIDLPAVDPSKYQKPKDAVASDEWLTVKLRYKHPDADTSKERVRVLPAKALGAALSDDFRFAAAVTGFGMVLQDSKWRGVMTYAGVLEEAKKALGKDIGGHRKEFVGLVERARALSARPGAPALGGRD